MNKVLGLVLGASALALASVSFADDGMKCQGKLGDDIMVSAQIMAPNQVSVMLSSKKDVDGGLYAVQYDNVLVSHKHDAGPMDFKMTTEVEKADVKSCDQIKAMHMDPATKKREIIKLADMKK